MPYKKVFFALVITDIALLVAYELSKWILRINHLTYRNAVNYTVYAALVIITLAISVQVIVFLFRRVKQREGKTAIRILSGVGIAVIIAFIAFASLSIFIRGVFGHQPEHVVEKDGRIMLARVDSFLQVEVRYYDHVNAFVRGGITRIHEDYGNGGYDPFEWEEMPKVQRYIYYDENGEIVESNWFDGYGVSPPSGSGATATADSEQVEIIELEING